MKVWDHFDPLPAIDHAMSRVTVFQASMAGGGGTILTYLLKDPAGNLAILTGVLTVILLLLKIVQQVRIMFGWAKREDDLP